MKHCIQYASIGYGRQIVMGTENKSDDEVRQLAFSKSKTEPISRFNRCPTCEEWTTSGGQLRDNIGCPAVAEAIRARSETK